MLAYAQIAGAHFAAGAVEIGEHLVEETLAKPGRRTVVPL
jgi:hypothetical protein